LAFVSFSTGTAIRLVQAMAGARLFLAGLVAGKIEFDKQWGFEQS